jgi:hypothetical protein
MTGVEATLAAGATLGRAPAAVVDPDGAPVVGAFAGHAGSVDWSALRGTWRRGRLWRAVHAKRWHYASIATGECVIAAAIIDIGWATSAFAYLFDRRSRKLLADLSWLGIPGLSARVSAGPGGAVNGGARSTFRTLGGSLALEEGPSGGWRLRTRGKLAIDAELIVTPATATMGAIARIDGGVANCTHKTVCLGVRGEARAREERFLLDGGSAAIDHTNGLLARDTRWRWASTSGERIGLNLVEGFNGPVENMLWIDGRLHPVGTAEFTFRAEAPLEPWRVRTVDGRVDLTFTPEGARAEDKNLGIAISRYVQPIGIFRGTVRGDGDPIDVELTGVTENHIARW